MGWKRARLKHRTACFGLPRKNLTELFSEAALIAATIEYSEIIQRRALHRRLIEAEHRAFQEAGLRGIVRLFLAER